MSVQQPQKLPACSGSSSNNNSAASNSVVDARFSLPVPGPGDVQSCLDPHGGAAFAAQESGCSYGVDESFPPLPEHLTEPYPLALPTLSLSPPPILRQSSSRASVTLEEGATLVYCSADPVISAKQPAAPNDGCGGCDGGGRERGYGRTSVLGQDNGQLEGVKEGLRRITDKYACPETLSLLRNGAVTAGLYHLIPTNSYPAPESSSDRQQGTVTLGPSPGVPYPQCPNSHSPVLAAASGVVTEPEPSLATPSALLQAPPSRTSSSPPSSSSSYVCPATQHLPIGSVPSVIGVTELANGVDLPPGGEELQVEMRPHKTAPVLDPAGIDRSTMSSSAVAEFRQNLNLRLSQKQSVKPLIGHPVLVKTSYGHAASQNHVTVMVEEEEEPYHGLLQLPPRSPSGAVPPVMPRRPSASRPNGVGATSGEGAGSGVGLSPLAIPVPAFSDTSSDISDSSPASPALTMDGSAGSPYGSVMSGGGGGGVGGGRGLLQSVSGLSLGNGGGVGVGVGLAVELTDSDLQQVEMFYKSHKTEVTVCRSLANLYVGAAAAATVTSSSSTTNLASGSGSSCGGPAVMTANGSSLNVTSGPASGSDSWEFVTTGIPLLVLDSGEHHRNRQLSVVIAEKGTGFCLWRDVVSHLTRYTCPHANFHTLRISTDTRKLAGLSFDDSQAAADFSATVKRLTSDPDDELLMLSRKSKGKRKSVKKSGGEKKKSVKYKAPRKTDISQPCCFQHVTKLERPQLLVGGALPLPPGSFPPAPRGSVSSLADVFHDRLSVSAAGGGGRPESRSSELSEGSRSVGAGPLSSGIASPVSLAPLSATES